MRTPTAAAPAVFAPPLAVLLAALGAGGEARAQQSAEASLDTVVISAQRSRQSSFDAPAAVSSVSREAIELAGPQVNLSEALNRLPGITVLNRQNYAQDLQMSIRGFGSRATFGIRGVRLIVDGIPATMPDGQGQASTAVLSSAGRIEVLRGPLAQLYGNAAGGVVQVFTEDDAPRPTATLGTSAGPYGQWRLGAKFSTSTPGWGLTVDGSHFRTDGYRPHSDAQRGQLNARWQAALTPRTDLRVVLNALDQPVSHDPGGLTRADWEADPRRTHPGAIGQDARKNVRQQQIGAVIEHRLSERTELSGRVYAGARDLDNALSIPPAAQDAPTSSGGMVQLDRSYQGAALQVAHAGRLDAERGWRVTAGVEIERMSEDRRGFRNDGGVQGALKRDERDTVSNHDAFAQLAVDVARDWTVTGGARSSRVKFRSKDRFIVPGNGDDSGGADYDAVNPVLGVAWRATPALNLYANAGRGFETPTFSELAYRPAGDGLNTALNASRSRHAEIGAKWKLSATQRLDVALFDIRTSDEIVVATSAGGRSTYRNAGRTTRRGIELSHTARLAEGLHSTLSLSAMRARFADPFTSGSGAGATTVPAGNRLPGTPERTLFAELAWAPKNAWGGFNAAVEVVHRSRLFVNDANDDAAPAATVVNLRAALSQQAGNWRFSELLRIENAGDRRYAGSVIVNDGNGRYFEPALPRHWLLGVTARYEFR